MKLAGLFFLVQVLSLELSNACSQLTNQKIFNYHFETIYQIQSCKESQVIESLVEQYLLLHKKSKKSVLISESDIRSVVATLSRDASTVGGDAALPTNQVQQIVDFYTSGPLAKRIDQVVLTSFSAQGLELETLFVFYDEFAQNAWILSRKFYEEKAFYRIQQLKMPVPGPF